MATIRKQDPTRGLWLRGKTYWLDFTYSAKRQRISLETEDLAVALQKAKEIRAFPERNFSEKSGDAIELFIRHQQQRGISQARQNFARGILSEMAKHAQKGRLEIITASQANKWWLEVLGRVKGKSAKDYLGQAKVFFRWAQDACHVTASPVALIIPPRIRPTPRRVFLEPADALRVLDQCGDQELKFALYCALHCGLRRGEVIAARPRWFDLKSGTLHVQNEVDWLTKDRDNRSIPLTKEFQEFLKEYGIRSPYMLRPEVLPKLTNRTWRYRTDFAKQFNGHMERLQLGHVTFHDLRRTFASLHASRGTPIFHIARWLGDDPSVVEGTYAHLLPNDDRINDPWTQARAQ